MQANTNTNKNKSPKKNARFLDQSVWVNGLLLTGPEELRWLQNVNLSGHCAVLLIAHALIIHGL